MALLYIVPTPIGNLEDITLRALSVLREADLILAEDTRTTAVLLNRYDIRKPLAPFHKFNEHAAVEQIAGKIASGQTLALVSDAGTPGISDPGFLLVRSLLERGIEVVTLPGATALVPALIDSGFPCDRFCFEGFLPHKKGKTKALQALAEETRTIILYESPHRLLKTLAMIRDLFPHDPMISVSRELTKKFEETVRGTAAELIERFTEKEPRGEFVVVIEGKKEEKKEKRNKYKDDED